MFQRSFAGIIKPPPPLSFIFKGIFKMMMMMMMMTTTMMMVMMMMMMIFGDGVEHFNAQVAKLCVAR